jgi:hypothetical protein
MPSILLIALGYQDAAALDFQFLRQRWFFIGVYLHFQHRGAR